MVPGQGTRFHVPTTNSSDAATKDSTGQNEDGRPPCAEPRPSKAKINKWFLKRGLGGQGKTSASAASASPAVMSDSDPAWCPSQNHGQQVRACVSSDLPLRSRPGSLCPSSWQTCQSQERPLLAKRGLCAHRCVHSDCLSHRCTSCALVTLLKPRPQVASGSQTCAGRLSLLHLLQSWSDWLFYRPPGAGLDAPPPISLLYHQPWFRELIGQFS